MFKRGAWRNVKPLEKLCRLFSVESQLILENLSMFAPTNNAAQSNLLESLANSRLSSIDPSVGVISYDDKWGVDVTSFSPDFLFVRDFYPDLLKAVRKNERSALIGNPGIGKSFFQYYYLARIMNPSLFGPLPPDCYGSTAPPKIVIRQEGTGAMTIYDIANRQAVTVNNSICVLDCFDPETSLYLMEPGMSVVEPHIGGLRIPTLTTVSPLLARYKEFCKNGGEMLFMPVFTLPELLAIGKHLVDCGSVPEDLTGEYTPEKITRRFDQFGGIFRHVLPRSLPYLEMCLRDQKEAINSCDAHALLVSGNIARADVSHFIMQYDVKKDGNLPFGRYRLDFVNEAVASQIQKKLNQCSLDDRRLALIRNDETGFMADSCPKIYEGVIAEQLTSLPGVEWKKRVVVTSCEKKGDIDIEWSDFSLRLDSISHGPVPPFAQMKPLVLYMSTNPIFPFVDFMYKTKEEGELIAIQVTREKSATKTFTWSAMKEFLKVIDISDDKVSLLRYVLIPSPLNADNARTKAAKNQRTTEEVSDSLLEVMDRYEVWNLPEDYCRFFRNLKCK